MDADRERNLGCRQYGVGLNVADAAASSTAVRHANKTRRGFQRTPFRRYLLLTSVWGLDPIHVACYMPGVCVKTRAVAAAEAS